jgi:hypothetical protein
MFKAPLEWFLSAAWAGERQAFACGEDFSDEVRLGEATAGEGLVDRRGMSATREEEFKILTPAEGQSQGIQAEKLGHMLCRRIHRNMISIDPRSHPTLLGQSAEIRGETIAQVDHGRGESGLGQDLPFSIASHGIELSLDSLSDGFSRLRRDVLPLLTLGR